MRPLKKSVIQTIRQREPRLDRAKNNQPSRHNDDLSDGFSFEPLLDSFGGEGGGRSDFFLSSEPTNLES
jgi:hypothetical protein